MNTLILRTAGPLVTAVMLLFSMFVLLRGHNAPGGGFIGGLIAAAAFATFGISNGVAAARRALWLHPMTIAGIGLLVSALSGVPSLVLGQPFMTSLWAEIPVLGDIIAVSTPMVFDIGVYLVVAGALTSIALGLEDRDTSD
jgi:multicomponent Na+:H+ antiporter subunit B